MRCIKCLYSFGMKISPHDINFLWYGYKKLVWISLFFFSLGIIVWMCHALFKKISIFLNVVVFFLSSYLIILHTIVFFISRSTTNDNKLSCTFLLYFFWERRTSKNAYIPGSKDHILMIIIHLRWYIRVWSHILLVLTDLLFTHLVLKFFVACINQWPCVLIKDAHNYMHHITQAFPLWKLNFV